MQNYLFFKTKTPEGIILFCAFDAELQTMRVFEYQDVINNSASFKNLRLENTVIKAVDIEKIPTLSKEEAEKDSIYYAIPDNTGFVTLVSNRGELFRMSPNVLEHFKGRILNISRTKNGHEIHKHKPHTTALNRSLHSVNNTK